MSDITIIEALNKRLPRPLKQLKKISWITKGYVLNDNNKVTHLSILKCRLNGTIPQELFQLKELQYLDIRENGLKEIPQEIELLTSLKYIDIRNNQLSDLPASIGQLTQLQRFYLGQNNYSSVPKAVGHLKALDLIDFSDNQIRSGCEYLLDAPCLRNIYLNNNEITSFPFSQVKANQLEELVLIDNPLDEYTGTTRDKINRLVL